MSKPVKQMIMRDYAARLGDTSDAMLISIRGLKAVNNTRLRQGLAKKQIKIAVMRNSLARKTFEGTPLAPLAELLSGSSAVAFGGSSVVEVARELVSLISKFPEIEFKGAVLDGMLFKGKAGVEELSKFPTRSEAIANNMTLILSPARKLASSIAGPGAGVAGLVKAIEERLEKGEAIAKKAG